MEEVKTHEGTANTQSEDHGVTARTFTQEEVNKLVSARLRKDRSRATEHSQAVQEAREAALREQESRLSCLSYLRTRNLREELLNILDTSDPEKFRAQAQGLLELCPSLDRQAPEPPAFSLAARGRREEFGADPFATAFGRK